MLAIRTIPRLIALVAIYAWGTALNALAAAGLMLIVCALTDFAFDYLRSRHVQ